MSGSPQQRLFAYAPPAGLLDGKITVITGANRGIGRAVTLAAAEHGAQTILLGRDSTPLDKLADEILALGYPEPGIVPVNLESATVDDYAHIQALIATRYGRLDGVVLNAGVLGDMAPIAHYDPLVWARVFQVNVHSTFLLTQALLPLLEAASGGGSVIFTSSGVGRKARAYWGAYAASKFATEGLMQTLADELEEQARIRVNALNPGRVRTAMRAQAYPAENPDTLKPPSAITAAYLFLLGADSADVHGESLNAQSTP